jgi:biopolymer transport protein ExbD
MARVFRSRRQSAPFSELNVTNLIDIGFTLLIIFMITTPLVEQSIQVELPLEGQKDQTQKEEPKTETVGIDASGRLFWGDKMVDKDHLQSLLENAAERPVQPIIALRADRSLNYQAVIDVLDQIEKAGLTKLNIDTQAAGGNDDSKKKSRR